MAIELDEIREGDTGPCVRMTAFEGAPDVIERAVQLTIDLVVPTFRSKPGWQGLIALVSLDGRRAWTLSFWESQGAATESGGTSAEFRRRAAAAGLSISGLERLRVVFSEER